MIKVTVTNTIGSRSITKSVEWDLVGIVSHFEEVAQMADALSKNLTDMRIKFEEATGIAQSIIDKSIKKAEVATGTTKTNRPKTCPACQSDNIFVYGGNVGGKKTEFKCGLCSYIWVYNNEQSFIDVNNELSSTKNES